MPNKNILDEVQWDEKGLVCAIVQDAQTLRVLMVAWMNRLALQQTIETGYAHYYSRSRQKQWMKGEQSGHTQQVLSIFLDCDADAIVLKIKQNHGIACHTGRESCFYRQLINEQWQVVDDIIMDECEIYKK